MSDNIIIATLKKLLSVPDEGEVFSHQTMNEESVISIHENYL